MIESVLKAKFDRLKSGELTCEANVNDFLSKIEKTNKRLNIVLELDKNALKRAKTLDEKRKNNEELGELFGVVFLLKTNISSIELTASCASKTLETYKGSFNSDVVERLLEKDAIILGTVTHDEFASGATGESGAFGIAKNAACETRVPGGSSSGSASSVAAQYCDISLGTDTGGSCRVPASHCGVIGVKPTYGRISRYGIIDLAMSFDQVAVLSSDVYGSALVLRELSGRSENDPTTHITEVPDFTKSHSSDKRKIGIIPALSDMIKSDKVKEVYEQTIEHLKKEGHEIIEVEIKDINLGIQAYYPVVYVEFFSGTRKFDGLKYGEQIEEVAGEEIIRRMSGGNEISKSEFDGAYYKKALGVREVLNKQFGEAFKKVDFILTPASPLIPHKLGKKITVEENYAYDAFTTPVNLADVCASVISKWKVEDEGEQVPVGLQVIANHLDEQTMFEGLFLLEELASK